MKKAKLLCLILTFTTCSVASAKSDNLVVKNDSTVLQFLDSIYYYLDSLEVEEPKYVMAQALFERGWFQCTKCSWKYNNMFGFKGQSGKYLRFNTWVDCVIYYSNWQKKRYPKYKATHPKGTYLGFLKWCHFAESDEYSKHVQSMYNWINLNWSPKN